MTVDETDNVSALEQADRKPPNRVVNWPFRVILLATAGYLFVTAIAMWPALSDLSNTIMGSFQPSDATNGGVWTAWQMQVLPPFATHTPWVAAPQGTSLWDATWITKLDWILPQWLLVELVGPVGSWTLALAIGFVLDGLAMFGMVRWLTRRDWIAFVAGLLYAFSPFHIEEAHAPIGYVYSFIFPLILWAGLALLTRPSARRAIIFGLAIGLAGYCDGLVFAPLFAVCIGLAGISWAKRLDVRVGQLVKALVLSAGTALIVALPLLIVYMAGSSSVNVLLGDRATNYGLVTAFSAQFWMYFVPWSGSLPWDWLTQAWVANRLGRPYLAVEDSLYLGSVVVLLALVPLLVSIVTGARERTSDRSATGHGLPTESTIWIRMPVRFLAPVLLTLTGVLMLCSFAWFGPIPGVPMLIYQLKPYWRVYTRLDVAVDATIVLAAAVGLALLAHHRHRWVASLLAVLAIIDGTAIVPWSFWSYSQHTPAAYKWLECAPGWRHRGYVSTAGARWSTSFSPNLPVH